MPMTEHATRVKLEEELKIEPETVTYEQTGSPKALPDFTPEHAELRKSAYAAKKLVDS